MHVSFINKGSRPMDYYKYRTDCYLDRTDNTTKRVEKYDWIYPQFCNTSGLELPPSTIIPCLDTCPPGQDWFFDRCRNCPPTM
jgi:hypothetical protein